MLALSALFSHPLLFLASLILGAPSHGGGEGDTIQGSDPDPDGLESLYGGDGNDVIPVWDDGGDVMYGGTGTDDISGEDDEDAMDGALDGDP